MHRYTAWMMYKMNAANANKSPEELLPLLSDPPRIAEVHTQTDLEEMKLKAMERASILHQMKA